MTSFVSRLINGAVETLAEGHQEYAKKHDVVEIRRKRKKMLDKWAEVGTGPPVRQDYQIEVLVDMALQEAVLRPHFNPDLLIVTEMQYKEMFDIPVSVPVDPEGWHHYLAGGAEKRKQDRHRVLPPKRYTVDAGEIDVVWSQNANRMALVESASL